MSAPTAWGGLHSHALLDIEGDPLIDGVTTDRAAARERLDQVLAVQPGVWGVLVRRDNDGPWVDERGLTARAVLDAWIAELATSNAVTSTDPAADQFFTETGEVWAAPTGGA